MTGEINTFESSRSLAQGAAERVIKTLSNAVATTGLASIVLSGGRTPREVYELLGSEANKERVPWSLVHVFWGDERCVAPTMPESNYRSAREALLESIDIPEGNIHRIHGESPPQEAARQYEQEIRTSLGLRHDSWPHFSLVLLGLGTDGHTASLFPGTLALQDRKRIVTEVYVESLKSSRITLTLPALNSAQEILFLVSGKMKASIFRSIRTSDTPQYPAQLIQPATGRVSWLIDRDVADPGGGPNVP
jgi:6-phosphogluconolactonase